MDGPTVIVARRALTSCFLKYLVLLDDFTHIIVVDSERTELNLQFIEMNEESVKVDNNLFSF